MAIAVFVGELGVVGGRILATHLLVVAIVVAILRLRVPESQEWIAEREHTRSLPVQEARRRLAWTELLRRPYVVALAGVAVFYGFVNVAANTFGQFSTYVYTKAAGLTVSQASIAGFVAVSIAILTSVLFVRVVDSRRKRYFWFTFGGLLKVAGFIVPIALGANLITILIANLASNIAGQLAGEPAFKIWAQELFPARLRASAQGVAIAFTRLIAALVALFTPGLIALPLGINGLFGLVAGLVLVAVLIGVFWLRKTPLAKDRPADPAAAPVVRREAERPEADAHRS
jgi:inositol transporter-like SP family MFS transporter